MFRCSQPAGRLVRPPPRTALERGVDGYTATDDLWEVLAARLATAHAQQETSFFLWTATPRSAMREASPVLFSREFAFLPIVWTGIDTI